MLAAFKDYIKETALFRPNDKILLAVSGGVDSMVMGHLFHTLGTNFGIAHCNFQLRGKASEEDALFVQAIAEKWEVPFYTISFETKVESAKQQTSIELTARNLRYKWFAELLQEHDYQFVATAHHLNDSLETLLYNLAKGTGIRGLHGIPVKNGRVIRPLSFASRQDILTYADDYQIQYRTDVSNEDTTIMRNLIRHKVIPALKEINPSLEQTFSRTIKQMKETEQLYLWAINEQKKLLLVEEDGLLKIKVDALKKAVAKTSVLYEIIKLFGFSSDHADQILRAIDNVGAQFYSKSYHITVGRKAIVVQRKQNATVVWVKVHSLPDTVNLPNGELVVSILKEKPTQLNWGKSIALLDLDKVQLPLLIRTWQEGDRFQPLGMQEQSKKIKDFLRDEKVPVYEKDSVLVVESAGKIVWIIGHRMDERFKIAKNTERILKMSW
ncbi:MAG: tRNA lysidine(34) synthetase TilS [Bacteroidota bacterium]